ncbi:cytochrome b/b6 domain-containing protein [Specibacter sp. RAF43]|uniref:cytochrome b/b6 domain-containing protein n=1 Tax=Specibacter sp. RAF43 TaxID=3233057 RepID=UPI003F9DD1EB
MSTSTKLNQSAVKSRWFKLVWIIPAAVVVLFLVVLTARWLRELPTVQLFMTDYTGASRSPEGAPVGFPAWLGWQHFLNSFFILLIIRTGWQVRTVTKPAAHWTRNNNGLVRTENPPAKISLNLWFHLTLDALWVLNGIVFYILIFSTGQWKRLVPTSWDVFPNAISTAIQYASLNWPTENGWVNYNSLQLLAYFTTVFIAAPLALATGLRMSGAWPRNAARVNKIYPVELARAIHFPVMLYFVLFIIAHVTLVMATGALHNLNHMYAARDDGSWAGFWIFAGSLVVMIAAWMAAQPMFLRPIASLTGKLSR